MTPFARPSLVALLLLTGALAGCVAQDLEDADVPTATDADGGRLPLDALTQPLYDSVLREASVIEGDDGTDIWLDVYRPDGADVPPGPTILVMTPYQSLGDALGVVGGVFGLPDGELPPFPPEAAPYSPNLVAFFVPRGYAVAFADVRGNHNAGGCIDQTGPEQWRDGYAVIQWLAEQPWSNGAVGMTGVSYDGETQVSNALLNPPALKTIVPVASVQSQYQYLYYDGVPYNLQGAGTMGAYLAISLVPGTDPNAVTTYPERLECQPENLQESLDLSGDWSPYWEERAYWKLANQSHVPMLHVHGLGDWNVKPDNIDPLFTSWAGEKRAIYGQWGHAWPDREDWWDQGGILHRWFDHWLLGIDTGIMEDLPPVLIEDTDGTWRGLDAFPPRGDERLRLSLGTERTLGAEGAAAGEVTIHDAVRDDPALQVCWPQSMLMDILSTNVRGEPVATDFWTEPLEEDMVLAGRPTVTFNATSDRASTHWVAILYEESADGTWTWLNRGYRDTRHLQGVERPTDVTPGEAYTVTITMFPQNDVVKAGSRLGLVLMNDDCWVHQDTTYATSTIQLGEGVAVLDLPLLPRDAVDVPEDSLL